MNRLNAEISVTRRTGGGDSFHLEAAFADAGGITVVCGASGAGKSSLLLALLGALDGVRGRLDFGEVTLLDSSSGIDLPPRRRRLGMVFQDAPLFPHLDVLRNVAFGIRGRERSTAARELLERVGATELARRRPHELSGGQVQRVALARALGPEPRALLLDEPFSALDPAARESLGRLLVELQQTTGIPFVHVTHDLGEALRLGTQLLLLDEGRVVQTGPPSEVIARPASVAAARSVGTENLFAATVVRHLREEGCTEVTLGGTTVWTSLLDQPPASPVTLGVRAEDILLSVSAIRDTSARNVLRGEVQQLTERGPVIELRVTTPASFRVIVTPASVRDLTLEPGREVWLLIKATAFHHLI